MRRHGRGALIVQAFLFLVTLCVLACGETTSAGNELVTGDCVSVTDLGEDDAAPARRVPCPPPGTTTFNDAEFRVYRIVVAETLTLPVMSRDSADALAGVYCRHPEIVPGTSLYVFPTEASFAAGFRQFLCLAR